MQAFPSQQPSGHEELLQMHAPVLVLHTCPVAHAAHDAPFAPHDEVDSLPSVSHAPVDWQQPAQAPPLHEHVPLAQA
jgi:hypothetical protein